MFSDLFSRCSKSGRIRGINPDAWPKWSMGIAGLIAVVWYLVRVIPKPSRAAYPCMRATTPIRLGFIVWIISLLSSVFSFRKAKTLFGRARYFYGTLFLALSAVSMLVFISSNVRDASAGFIGLSPSGPNNPIGVARGIFPGRVAWVHNPDAGKWTGTGNWWADAVNDQAEYDKMIPRAVISLSGGTSEADAWDRIFNWFNEFKGRAARGYQSGESIAIKINQNNSTTHGDNNSSNGNPHLILALLKSLVNGAGVPQNMITVSDPSRAISNAIFNKCHAAFPDVVYEDHLGGNGRVKATYAANAIPYSVNNGQLAQGIASSFVNTRYVINMAILKGHSGTGITFGAKNFYGSTSISSNWRENHHNNFNQSPTGANKYMTFTDFMGHKDLGEKTILWLMDAIYPNQHLGGTPGGGWSMAPFNGSRPSSIFASLDGVANESVSLDFFLANWPNAVKLEYCDQYMHEAALAHAPPSGTFYDPEKDGSRLISLGVHEHWNNAVSKQYSRNLGSGEGIELVYLAGAEDPGRPVGTSSPANGSTLDSPATSRAGPSMVKMKTGGLAVRVPEGRHEMRVYSMDGSLVMRRSADNASVYRIGSYTGIPPGTYSVQVQSNGVSWGSVAIVTE